MKSPAYNDFDKLTSDYKLPVVDIITRRLDELREQITHQRNVAEINRIQGAMAECETLLTHLNR